MRLIFMLLLANFVLGAYGQATSTTKAIQNGNWDEHDTWDNGVPEDGDMVEIPTGITVSVVQSPYNQSPETDRPRLTLNILGTLSFAANGSDRLYLNSGSIIQLFSSGVITSNHSASTEIIAIYSGTDKTDNVVFDNNPSLIAGPRYATAATLKFALGVLPVKLKSFTAQLQRAQVVIKWSTAEELNASRFEVERSTDGRNWHTLEIVGIKGPAADYAAMDAAPVRGENLYRLKLVDLDGKTEISDVLKVNTDKVQTVHFGPNPASSFITITLSGINSSQLQVQLLGTKGQVVKEATYKPGQSSFFTFHLQGVAKGLYTLVIRHGEAPPEASQLIVQ